jgi:hypothetical protein
MGLAAALSPHTLYTHLPAHAATSPHNSPRAGRRRAAEKEAEVAAKKEEKKAPLKKRKPGEPGSSAELLTIKLTTTSWATLLTCIFCPLPTAELTELTPSIPSSPQPPLSTAEELLEEFDMCTRDTHLLYPLHLPQRSYTPHLDQGEGTGVLVEQ